MECMPTAEKGQQVTRVTLKAPRGKWPLDTGPSTSVAAETHKCCSSRLSHSLPALETGVNLKREEACLRMRHGIHIYTVYASREDVFLQKGCVQNLPVCARPCARARVGVRVCMRALHIYLV